MTNTTRQRRPRRPLQVADVHRLAEFFVSELCRLDPEFASRTEVAFEAEVRDIVRDELNKRTPT